MKLVTIQPFFNKNLNPETSPLDANGLPITNYLHDPLFSLKNTLPAIYDGANAYYPLAHLGYEETSWNEWILTYGYDPQEVENLRQRFISYRKEHPYTDFLAQSPAETAAKAKWVTKTQSAGDVDVDVDVDTDVETKSAVKVDTKTKTQPQTTAQPQWNEQIRTQTAQENLLPPYFSKYHAKLLSPVPQPLQDVLCIGMNYCKSAEERQKCAPPENMLYFGKRSYRLAGHGETLPNLEAITDLYLFEAELAVILSKPLYHAQSVEEVRSAIFAYSLFNDFTAPKVCEKFQQAYIGKSLPGFAVLGPWLIPASDFETYLGDDTNTRQFEVQGFKNGCLVQEGKSTQMIRSVEEILLELSQYTLLAPGTILATGTPPDLAEVADTTLKPPYKQIRPGDQIDCYCAAIGHLENQIDE